MDALALGGEVRLNLRKTFFPQVVFVTPRTERPLNHDRVDASPFEGQWAGLCALMEKELGGAAYKSWLSQLTLEAQQGTHLVIASPTRFVKDWVQANYGAALLKLAQTLTPTLTSLDIIVKEGMRPLSHARAANGGVEMSTSTPATPRVHAFSDPDEMPAFKQDLSAMLDTRYTFENFVVGKPNELAYAAARRVAESKEAQFNPLFLYGGVGLGKTHLMHAIAWHIRTHQPKRRVIYLSAEKFMYQFIRALRFKDTVSFKDQFRNVDVLMIDDVQFISGKDTTQEEFFHTFNALVDKKHQVIISADKSPSDLEGMEERLKSRLGWGLVADIHPTTYELRLGILQAKVDTISTPVPKDVMEFLAAKISSNVRELEGAMNRIVAHATLVGRQITLDSTQDLLRDLLKANDRRISVDEIQKRVAEFFGMKLSEMQSSKRSQNVARPRQVAMYLAKVMTTRSLPELGRRFGGRDHTTVLHAVRKIEELMLKDKEFAEDVILLRRSLES